jgi:PAS domain S-box-containing protein
MDLALIAGLWDRSGTAVEVLADTSGILILLAAGFLVFRTFRERYLLAWILGWSCYLVYRLANTSPQLLPASLWMGALSQAAYIAAVTLFVAALLFYTNSRRFLTPLAIAALVTLAISTLRAVWWRDSLALLWLMRVLYTGIALAGALRLATYSRGRRQVGTWLIVVMLVLLHYDDDPNSVHVLAGIDTMIELLLGLSMLIVVLDDSQTRSARLSSVNAIATAIGRGQDSGAMVLTALEELKQLLRARAAWFRLLDADSMVLTHQVGLSENFITGRASLDARSGLGEQLVRQGTPTIVCAATTTQENRDPLRAEGLHHVLLVPVKGKTSVIGTICIGQAAHRSYPAEELDFLSVMANQIGIAVENLRLLEQIMRSHREWISTFDSIKDLILVHDPRFQILKVNRAMLQRLDHGYQDMIFKSCESVLPGGGQSWHRCPYCEHARANFTEGPDPCFGGFTMVSSSSFSEQGGDFVGTIHIIRDTTDRRAAEEKYRLLFEQVQEGVFVSTPEGRLLDVNDAFVQMLGYHSREEVLALDVARDLYAAPEQRQGFCELIAAHSYVRNYEVTLRRKDGSIIYALENSFASRDGAGNIERFQGFLLDITEKKRAEDEIRRRNRELHALNSIAVIATQSFDLDEIVNTSLRHIVELFSADTGGFYLLDEAQRNLRRRATHGHRSPEGEQLPEVQVPQEFLQHVHQAHIELLTQADLPQLPAFVTNFISGEGLQAWIWVIMWAKEKPVGILGISSHGSRRFTATDESLMVAIGRQLATTIEKVRLYEETCRAYEDLRRAQEQLLQSEKMSAVGQLISGVAHELNNPLTAILGYAQLLENEALGEHARDFVDKLFKQAQRTQRLVQNLLSFARQRKPEKKEVDIRRVLEDTMALREYDLKLHNIAVQWESSPALPGVVADAHQMEQVFLNIINNAADAMLEHSPGGSLRVNIYREDGHVCAEFHDSGPGIREPKRVFDPFYTTKSVGKGTGLGLSICYGIVKEHGGDIMAMNHPEGGALFRVLLPASEAPGQTTTAAPARHTPLSGHVLLVDDEQAVLEFEREVLTGAGAEVVAVSNGEEAIRHLERERFDLVLVDCDMPGHWNGPEIYRWVVANRPGSEANIILAASSIRDLEVSNLVAQGRLVCLKKPFQVTELISITQTLLGKARAAGAN